MIQIDSLLVDLIDVKPRVGKNEIQARAVNKAQRHLDDVVGRISWKTSMVSARHGRIQVQVERIVTGYPEEG